MYLFQYLPQNHCPLVKRRHLVSESWQVTAELGPPDSLINQTCGQWGHHVNPAVIASDLREPPQLASIKFHCW